MHGETRLVRFGVRSIRSDTLSHPEVTSRDMSSAPDLQQFVLVEGHISRFLDYEPVFLRLLRGVLDPLGMVDPMGS